GVSGGMARRGTARQPSEAVGAPEVRSAEGLVPSDTLLFNGWGVTPTGEHVRLPGDMPLKMVVSPDGSTLAAVTAGFSNHGVALVDLKGKQVAQWVPLAKAWNGIAFS